MMMLTKLNDRLTRAYLLDQDCNKNKAAASWTVARIRSTARGSLPSIAPLQTTTSNHTLAQPHSGRPRDRTLVQTIVLAGNNGYCYTRTQLASDTSLLLVGELASLIAASAVAVSVVVVVVVFALS